MYKTTTKRKHHTDCWNNICNIF